jgi:hypothetical protein
MKKQTKRLPPPQLGLIIGLIVLSTALFVLGISLERQLEANENANTHVEGEEGEIHNEGSEEAHDEAESSESEGEEHGEEGETPEAENHVDETIVGINLENPWLITTAVVAWIVLALALLRFGYPVLYLIILAALVMGVMDVVELIRQLNIGHSDIAFVAALVAASHLILAIVSFMNLRRQDSLAVSP